MDRFSPMIQAVGSYVWLIFFILVVFVFQKPIIRLFRRMNERSAKGKGGQKNKADRR